MNKADVGTPLPAIAGVFKASPTTSQAVRQLGSRPGVLPSTIPAEG